MNLDEVECCPKRETRNRSPVNAGNFVLFECAGHGAVRQTITAAGAFILEHFISVMNILHLGMDRTRGADFAAETAGDAKALDDSNFHFAGGLAIRMLRWLSMDGTFFSIKTYRSP